MNNYKTTEGMILKLTAEQAFEYNKMSPLVLEGKAEEEPTTSRVHEVTGPGITETVKKDK